jgi:putative ABC transport system permease protein
MVGILRDLRFAVRLLFHSPTFTAISVLTLGLGIGAVTAIFSVVNAVILRPLPFPEPNELVQVYTQFPTMKFDKFWVSPPEYFDIARDARSFESVAGYQAAGAAITARDRPVRAAAAYSTHTFARTIGVQPALGRWFAPYEDLPGDVQAFVISHRFWQNAFGGDAEILGKRVMLDGMSAAIVGIMPEGFHYPEVETDLWIPLQLDPSSIARGNHRVTVFGRLAEGATLEGARAEMSSLMAGWKEAGTGHVLAPPNHPVVMYSLKDEIIGGVRTTLWLLQAAVIFVLLIACANVSNLLLARAEARSREIAIRNALGANRWRLVRQFLTESALLGILGGLLGLIFAIWGVDMTVALLPEGAPRATEIGIDLSVLAFGMAASFATSLIFGLAPVLHTRVDDLGGALKEGQRSTSSTRQRFRSSLVVFEVAVAVVLVIGCGLVIRSFVKLQEVDLGFRPDGLVTGQVEIVDKRYPTPESGLAFWLRAQEELRAQPGVKSATVMTGMPPSRRINANDATFEGKVPTPDGPAFNIDFWQTVGDDFFETMGMRLVAGRFLRASDNADSLPVVVINEALARRFYPGEDPIGKRIRVAGGPNDRRNRWQTIVGVVGDVKQQGVEAPTGTEVFLPMRQAQVIYGGMPQNAYLVARTDVEASAMLASMRQVITRLDPTVPVYQLRTMEQILYDSVGKARFVTFLLLAFAGLALALAAIGVYGVISYSVAQRTRELGIRMALGAQASAVRRLVMGEGLLLAGIGVLIGLGVTFAVNTALAARLGGLLYDVRAVDPPTFVAVAVVVVAVAALACFVPALRATRVDPMIALRHD